jgi:CubicO group peptidase (beta-lactamase class C family)
MGTRRQLQTILLCAAALAAAAFVATPRADAGGGRLNAALDRIIDDPMGPPGLSVLIQRGKRVEFRRRGVADLETGAKPKRRSPMRIASMAKSFNGAIALALASKRKLDLDDTIGQWLPGVWPLADAGGALVGLLPGDQVGHAVAGLGDTDGDGVDDALIGAPGAGGTGAAYVILGGP